MLTTDNEQLAAAEDCKVCGNVKREDGSCPTCNGGKTEVRSQTSEVSAPNVSVPGAVATGLTLSPMEELKQFVNNFGMKHQRIDDGSIGRGECSRGYHRAMRDVYDQMERLGLA